MKKILVFVFSLLFTLSYSQYAVVDFIALNEGTDADYHNLEKVWKVYHQKSIDKGEKTGWAVWKKTPMNSEYYDEEAQYVVINQFASKEQLEKWTKNFNYENAVTTMKNGLKFESSTSLSSALDSHQMFEVKGDLIYFENQKFSICSNCSN